MFMFFLGFMIGTFFGMMIIAVVSAGKRKNELRDTMS